MRIVLHIGLPHCGIDAVQSAFDAKRDQLAGKGVLYAKTPGGKNHSKLYMAALEPGHVDPLRANRGYGDPAKHRLLEQAVMADLKGEIGRTSPETLILSAGQFAWLPPAGIARLRALLAPLSDDIRILAHLDEQARVAVRSYTEQLWLGRTGDLTAELAMGTPWWDAALAAIAPAQPALNRFFELQSPPHWLDYAALRTAWEAEFGKGAVTFRPYDPAAFAADIVGEIVDAFDLPKNIGKADAPALPAPPSAAWLARARGLNEELEKVLATGRILPRKLWRRFMAEIAVPGDPLSPGRLADLSARFKKDNAALARAFPGLSPALKPDKPGDPYAEADPALGFRASQYVAAFLPRIDKATRDEAARREAVAQAAPKVAGGKMVLSPSAEKLMPPLARANMAHLSHGRFAPHNRLGDVPEDEAAAPYAEREPHRLENGSTGNVIVGCMKNEAPYILEWVAYHRAIGVDDFIIYTNGCEDGTTEILDRLQAMGILQHRDNNEWKGKSPQQAALNKSLKEPVIENAEWIIHIDVDEFMNIRCGNGTLDDLFARVPDATNIAMTWRLFGHNGVTELNDDLVIAQFDACAPKWAPKPHTVWGFKTMFRNIAAYDKISCHRPNKMDEAKREIVRWVNGSGEAMGEEIKTKGWRSSMDTIGYDLIQLNHYALRSAESFLIKRQRGRALHVDRSIGINYWVRMDFNDYRDVTIQRNIPRTRAELARLMADPDLARLHAAGLDWHRAKARELHDNPEFEDLYQQALDTRLTDLERVAFSLALDMES